MLSIKAPPSELDREAARLFSPAPGVRAWVHGAWARGVPSTLDDSTVFLPEGSSYGLIRGAAEAFDTDDSATVGVMLAQVEAKKHEILSAGDRTPVDVRWVWSGPHVLGFVVGFEDEILGEGPTRGAALVAAMRFVKEGV